MEIRTDRLILRLPADERDSVLALLNEFLPFRGLWQRSFGRLTRPRLPVDAMSSSPPVQSPSEEA